MSTDPNKDPTIEDPWGKDSGTENFLLQEFEMQTEPKAPIRWKRPKGYKNDK